jgi:hypothetical protein
MNRRCEEKLITFFPQWFKNAFSSRGKNGCNSIGYKSLVQILIIQADHGIIFVTLYILF